MVKPRDSHASQTEETDLIIMLLALCVCSVIVGRTDFGQINRQELRRAGKSVVNRWNITPNNEKDDAGIVELVPKLGDIGRVIADGVVCSTHAQTQESTGEETRPNEQVGFRSSAIPRNNDGVEEDAGDSEAEGAEEMRPDVDALVVQVAQALEGAPVAVAGGPVAAQDVGVVSTPWLQLIPDLEEGFLDFGFDLFGGVDYGLGRGARATLPELGGSAPCVTPCLRHDYLSS